MSCRSPDAWQNLYVGINPRRGELAGTAQAASADDVVARRAVVLDLDNKDAPGTDPNWTRTRDALVAEFNPLLVLDSGNGCHVWLDVQDLSGPDLAASAGPLAASMARMGADNMADPARIARLPYTPNLPTAAKRKRGAVIRLAAPLPRPDVARTVPPSADALCGALDSLAVRLRLPGKGGRLRSAAAAGAASHYGPAGQRKTPRPAPSVEALRLLAEELPNDPGGPFDDRPIVLLSQRCSFERSPRKSTLNLA
jgi:hypothetical protein